MSAELDDLIPILVRGRVDFVLVGGMAAILHGSARVTFDIDLVYERSADNIVRLVQSLEPCSPYLRGAPSGLPFKFDEQTVKRGLNFTLTTTAGDLDLFGEIAGGGTYQDVLPYSEEVDAFGVTFLCIGLDRLIHLKRATRRAKDLEAIAELQIILEEEQNAADKAEGMKEDRGEILQKAIEKRRVVRFWYNGKERIVEPQTYGISTTGNEVLRAYQRGGGSTSGAGPQLKLFEVAKISRLALTDEVFTDARPEHNPQDRAMVEVLATLPKTKAR